MNFLMCSKYCYIIIIMIITFSQYDILQRRHIYNYKIKYCAFKTFQMGVPLIVKCQKYLYHYWNNGYNFISEFQKTKQICYL